MTYQPYSSSAKQTVIPLGGTEHTPQTTLDAVVTPTSTIQVYTITLAHQPVIRDGDFTEVGPHIDKAKEHGENWTEIYLPKMVRSLTNLSAYGDVFLANEEDMFAITQQPDTPDRRARLKNGMQDLIDHAQRHKADAHGRHSDIASFGDVLNKDHLQFEDDLNKILKTVNQEAIDQATVTLNATKKALEGLQKSYSGLAWAEAGVTVLVVDAMISAPEAAPVVAVIGAIPMIILADKLQKVDKQIKETFATYRKQTDHLALLNRELSFVHKYQGDLESLNTDSGNAVDAIGQELRQWESLEADLKILLLDLDDPGAPIGVIGDRLKASRVFWKNTAEQAERMLLHDIGAMPIRNI